MTTFPVLQAAFSPLEMLVLYLHCLFFLLSALFILQAFLLLLRHHFCETIIIQVRLGVFNYCHFRVIINDHNTYRKRKGIDAAVSTASGAMHQAKIGFGVEVTSPQTQMGALINGKLLLAKCFAAQLKGKEFMFKNFKTGASCTRFSRKLLKHSNNNEVPSQISGLSLAVISTAFTFKN